MEWKMFGIKGKLVSTKNKVFKLFRLIDSLGKGDSVASLLNPVFTTVPVGRAEALVYWRELRKAEALLNWQRWLDRPK